MSPSASNISKSSRNLYASMSQMRTRPTGNRTNWAQAEKKILEFLWKAAKKALEVTS